MVFKHLVGLGVAKKLLEKTQDPRFVDRVILKYACDLALRIVSAVEFPCLGGLEKFRIGSAICESKRDGKGHFSAGQHSTPVGVFLAETNLNSVNGFVVEHHRHQDQSQGLGIAACFGTVPEKLRIIREFFFQRLSIDDFPEMFTDGRSERVLTGTCVGRSDRRLLDEFIRSTSGIAEQNTHDR